MAAIVAQNTAAAGLKAHVARRGVAARASRARVVSVSAAARPNFFPGSVPPAHLDGTMPADYGFDPLGLGKDKETLVWYQQAELMHSRWAMLGITGMVVPELFDNPLVEGAMPNWIEAPLYKGYFTDDNTLFVVQIFLMNWVEISRWQDMKKPGYAHEQFAATGEDVGYPGGGLFNPMGFATNEKDYKIARVKELANGRLAMMAVLGCFIQETVTKTGPIANLKAHLADPAHTTIFDSFHPIVLNTGL